MRAVAIGSLTEAPIESLIDAVYDAAFAPDEWQRVCDLFDAALGGAYVSIATHDLVTNRNVGAYYARHQDSACRQYKEYYDQKNLFIDAVRNRPVDTPMRIDEIVPQALLERSEFYTDWLKPQDDLSSGGLFVVSNAEHRLVLFSALLPRRDAESKLPALMAMLDRLAPHMRRSLRINQNAHRVSGKASILETFMEEARAAFLVLDEEGRPLEVNRQARTLFEAGILTQDLRGAVKMNIVEGTAYIENAVNEAVAGTNAFGDGIAVVMEDGTPSAFLRAIPLGTQGKSVVHHLLGARSAPAVIISIASPQPMLKAAQARYALSPAELAVLRGLIEGKGLKDLAAERKTSVNTVRNQVASLLEKTGTSSQKELIGLFAATKRL